MGFQRGRFDPKEKLAAVLMMQAPALRPHYRYLMRHYVYQAIMDSPKGLLESDVAWGRT